MLLQFMQTVDDLGAERDAVAGQQDLDLAAREVILLLFSIAGVEVDASKTGWIFSQLGEHVFDVALHMEMLLPGQLCDLAAAHGYRLGDQCVAHVLSSRKDEARSEAGYGCSLVVRVFP
ncbi:hypothetical protein A7D27_17510 [Pseudomonas sp. 1D4]|nr:hypothetical protein A7D27_17510 [Pseudomonas sp. 1D4]